MFFILYNTNYINWKVFNKINIIFIKQFTNFLELKNTNKQKNNIKTKIKNIIILIKFFIYFFKTEKIYKLKKLNIIYF